MTAAPAAAARPPSRVGVLPVAAVTAALLLAACLTWRGELAGIWQRLQIQAEEPAGVCVAAVAARAAAAEATAIKAGAPPLKQLEAEVVAQQCSDEFRAAAYKNGTEGSVGPPLMARGCPLEQCNLLFVLIQLRMLRQHSRFDSLLRMVPCDMWRALRGRTLWLVGDSQAQRFHRQLACFLAPFVVPEKYRAEPEWRPEGQRFCSDPACEQLIQQQILADWDGCCGVEHPICTRLLGGGMVCHLRINQGPHMLRTLQRMNSVFGLRRSDIVEFNIGLWHHKREGQYEGFVQALADHYAANGSSGPTLIWRDNSPQHFDIENGEFPHPDEAPRLLYDVGKGGRCVPIKGVTLQPDGTLGGDNEHVKRGGWRNIMTDPIMEAAGIPIHRTWNNTVMLYAGHTQGECTHWCSPGAYSIWIWSLWRTLLNHNI